MSNFSNKTALIIEDDEPSVKVLEHLLERESMRSESILNTRNIIEELSRVQVPDVIFLDLEMPKTNGYRVLEAIQADSRFEGIPIVAYTTHVSHLNESKKAGFHSFLGKPIDPYSFSDQLARILNDEPVWEISD